MNPDLMHDKNMTESIILVDESDRKMGTTDKLVAHIDGALHRAVSVYVFNSEGRLLLTRRAAGKYHSGGLWTNTCCTHPWPGETTQAAVRRCLRKEVGIDCQAVPAFHFIYRAQLENGLTEHELDHVFVATYDGEPDLNLNEADAYIWVDLRELGHDIATCPEKYTAWLPLSLDRAVETQRAQRIIAAGGHRNELRSWEKR